MGNTRLRPVPACSSIDLPSKYSMGSNGSSSVPIEITRGKEKEEEEAKKSCCDGTAGNVLVKEAAVAVAAVNAAASAVDVEEVETFGSSLPCISMTSDSSDQMTMQEVMPPECDDSSHSLSSLSSPMVTNPDSSSSIRTKTIATRKTVITPHPYPVSRMKSLHRGLVRDRSRLARFEDFYEVVDIIGWGGLCQVLSIRKLERTEGSSRVRLHRRRANASTAKTSNITSGTGTGATMKLLQLQGFFSAPNIERRNQRRSLSDSSVFHPESIRTTSDEICTTNNTLPTTIPTTGGSNSSISSNSSLSGRSGPPQYFAAKVFQLKLLTQNKITQLETEIEALKTLDHRSIIKAYETFHRPESKQLLLIMELCTGGDLTSRMPTYTESSAVIVLEQILNALVYLHENRGMIHRDLKLENILYESPHEHSLVKLIDFGLAASLGGPGRKCDASDDVRSSDCGSSVLKERVGTLYCMAPNVLLGTGYGRPADMWSVGVITYTLLSNGVRPFDGPTPKHMVAQILQGAYEFLPNEIWGEEVMSSEARDFVRSLLQIEPSLRLTARQAIRHPWIVRWSCNHGCRMKFNSSDTNLQLLSRASSVSAINTDSSDSPASSIQTIHRSCDDSFKHQIASGLVRYAAWNDFRKLALNVVAKRSSADDIFEIRRIFDEFDTQRTGTIALDEFREILTQQFGSSIYSEADQKWFFDNIDLSHTSVINYTEFLAAALETQGTIEEWRLAEAFDLLDYDDTGYISKVDLRRVVGSEVDDSYLDLLIQQAGGSTRDGRISYANFLEVFSEEKHDLIYDMYEEASPQATSNLKKPGLATASATHLSSEEVLKQKGIQVPPPSRRRKGNASPPPKVRQLLKPVTRNDLATFLTTGRVY